MKKIVSAILLFMIMCQYMIGCMGLTMHHCCCNRMYHVMTSVEEAYLPYHIHNCEKRSKEYKECKVPTFRQMKCCFTKSFVMDDEHGAQDIVDHVDVFQFVYDLLSSCYLFTEKDIFRDRMVFLVGKYRHRTSAADHFVSYVDYNICLRI